MVENKLDDAAWNKKLDEFLAKENERAGTVEIPSPPQAIKTDEYDRGINFGLVTEDLIRHYADGMGDPNPLWRDPSYAKGTRWGGIVAPPTYEGCIAYDSFAGYIEFKYGGFHKLVAGNKYERFKPLRPGDEFRIVDKIIGWQERKAKDKDHRVFVGSKIRSYINQRDELVSSLTLASVGTGTPPSQRGELRVNKYKEIKRRRFTQEELDAVHRNYDNELAGKLRRGKEVLYWEDVVVGESLKPIAKGPLDLCDALARTVVSCYSFAYAIKWAAIREHQACYPIDPETGDYRFIRDWHYEDSVARLMGMPYAFQSGAQNEMMIAHLVSNWMGDDGFVKTLDCRHRSTNILGDINWLKGTVTKKYVENGEHLVDLDLWAENLEGRVPIRATATVKLIAKAG
jgi:acyl dehydratase